MNDLPWEERVTMLSVNPEAATEEDVTRMAAEMMEARRILREACIALDAVSVLHRAVNPDAPMLVTIDGILDEAGYDRSEGEKL